MAVRPIDGAELLGIERLLDTDVVRKSKTASWLLDQVLHDIQAMPTLTPPNEPLTIEQLREMDGEAVYLMPMKWWALVDSPKGLKRVILRLKGGGWAAFYSDEDLKNYVEAVYRI